MNNKHIYELLRKSGEIEGNGILFDLSPIFFYVTIDKENIDNIIENNEIYEINFKSVNGYIVNNNLITKLDIDESIKVLDAYLEYISAVEEICNKYGVECNIIEVATAE